MKRDIAAAIGGLAATVALAVGARRGFDADYQAAQGALIGEPVAFALAVGVVVAASFLASSRRWPVGAGLVLVLPTVAWAVASAGPDGFVAARPGAWVLTVILSVVGATLLVTGWLVAAALLPTRHPQGRPHP